ncbi:hypothetical protein GOV08_05455 [Candidatus Woesearchaeota archaeon]|nr:hypothetical protein [Candidatus Woesearchaeota archaeon]
MDNQIGERIRKFEQDDDIHLMVKTELSFMQRELNLNTTDIDECLDVFDALKRIYEKRDTEQVVADDQRRLLNRILRYISENKKKDHDIPKVVKPFSSKSTERELMYAASYGYRKQLNEAQISAGIAYAESVGLPPINGVRLMSAFPKESQAICLLLDDINAKRTTLKYQELRSSILEILDIEIAPEEYYSAMSELEMHNLSTKYMPLVVSVMRDNMKPSPFYKLAGPFREQ